MKKYFGFLSVATFIGVIALTSNLQAESSQKKETITSKSKENSTAIVADSSTSNSQVSQKIMKKVTVYSKSSCPYCVHAKNLLDQKGVHYENIDVGQNPEKAFEMIRKSAGKRTVPQIFIEEEHIGGFDDLKKLNEAGKLDEKLYAKEKNIS
jgi:glutaredoxin 3